MWSQYAMVALEKASALTGAAYHGKSPNCVVALHGLESGSFKTCPCREHYLMVPRCCHRFFFGAGRER